MTTHHFPEEYNCVLTGDIMDDPVMTLNGNTFERHAIEEWINRNGTCPMTRGPLSISDLRPNRLLRDLIQSAKAAATTATTATATTATTEAGDDEEVSTSDSFDAFLTHTWQVDEQSRPNHERVKRIYNQLTAKGLKVWFDEQQMRDDVVQRMIEGIDQSSVIVCCLTTKYIEKVASGNASDNCFKEFSYASRVKPAGLVAVPMETSCLNPASWTGRVNMELGGHLYEAAFDDDALFEENIEKLYQQIVRKRGELDVSTSRPEVPSPPAAAAGTDENLSVGQKVCWKFHDDDVPEGTVGVVKKLYSEENRVSVVFDSLPSNYCCKFKLDRLIKVD